MSFDGVYPRQGAVCLDTSKELANQLNLCNEVAVISQ